MVNRKHGSGLPGCTGILTVMAVAAAAHRARLDAEMDHRLVGEDSARNTRNGYGRKTVMTDTGKLKIDVPCDRQSSFDPQLAANAVG